MKTISIVIPCFNEEKTIGIVLEKVIEAKVFGLKKEIVVVDDGSTDQTKKVLKKYQEKIKIINLKNNRGKGAALRRGFLETKGDIVLVQDADLEYEPKEYETLIEAIVLGKADVVYGSRFTGDKAHRVIYFWHAVMNKVLTWLSNVMTDINLTDMETGFKAFKGDIIRNLAPKLESERFGIEPEMTAKLSKIKNIRFYEVGISYFGRTYEEGKHIKWQDGVKAVWEIIKYNLF